MSPPYSETSVNQTLGLCVVLWAVKPRSIRGEDQVPEEYAASIILKIEVIYSSEMLVPIYKTKEYYSSQDHASTHPNIYNTELTTD